MEISNLDKDFKVRIIKMLTDLGERIHVVRDLTKITFEKTTQS